MVKIQNIERSNASEDVEQEEFSFIAGGMQDGIATSEDSLVVS